MVSPGGKGDGDGEEWGSGAAKLAPSLSGEKTARERDARRREPWRGSRVADTVGVEVKRRGKKTWYTRKKKRMEKKGTGVG